MHSCTTSNIQVSSREEKSYKYCCNVSRIRQFKMFKVIASVLQVLYFVAQTMGTPNLNLLRIVVRYLSWFRMNDKN